MRDATQPDGETFGGGTVCAAKLTGKDLRGDVQPGSLVRLIIRPGRCANAPPQRGGTIGLDAAPTELWFLAVVYLQR